MFFNMFLLSFCLFFFLKILLLNCLLLFFLLLFDLKSRFFFKFRFCSHLNLFFLNIFLFLLFIFNFILFINTLSIRLFDGLFFL